MFRLIKSSDEYKFDSILINLITKFLLSIDFELSEYYFIELEDIIKKELSFYQCEEKRVQYSNGLYTRTSLLFPETLYKLLIFNAIGELHCESGLKSELVNFIVNKFIERSLSIYHLFYILRIIKAYKKIGPILLENGFDPLSSIERLINSVISTKADKLVDLKDSNLNILDSLEDEFGPMFTRRTQKYQLVTSCDERVKQELLSRGGTLDEIVTLDDAPLICSQKALQDYSSDIYLRSQNPYRLMQT